MKKKIIIGLFISLLGGVLLMRLSFHKQETYYFPKEDQPHEGTWLTWPHPYTYGESYAQSIEPIWVEMVKALAPDEKVHIVAYDATYEHHIRQLLQKEQVKLSNVDFTLAKTDDVWTRDTGPMFVYNQEGELTVADFAFDGWGRKAPYKQDDRLPQLIAAEKGLLIVDIADFVLEGGSFELSGDGTLLATKSSVISKNRNPKLSQKVAESYLEKYLGATHFIWLEGVTDEDITDAHIDGFARFYDEQTLLTVSQDDFYDLYEGILASDYQTLAQAKNAAGQPYRLEELPLTAENVAGLDYRGSYLNFYLGNKSLLLPVYGDANDAYVIDKLQGLYPQKRIVPINVVALYRHGGMLHCVTQQQPYDKEVGK